MRTIAYVGIPLVQVYINDSESKLNRKLQQAGWKLQFLIRLLKLWSNIDY